MEFERGQPKKMAHVKVSPFRDWEVMTFTNPKTSISSPTAHSPANSLVISISMVRGARPSLLSRGLLCSCRIANSISQTYDSDYSCSASCLMVTMPTVWWGWGLFQSAEGVYIVMFTRSLSFCQSISSPEALWMSNVLALQPCSHAVGLLNSPLSSSSLWSEAHLGHEKLTDVTSGLMDPHRITVPPIVTSFPAVCRILCHFKGHSAYQMDPRTFTIIMTKHTDCKGIGQALRAFMGARMSGLLLILLERISHISFNLSGMSSQDKSACLYTLNRSTEDEDEARAECV